MRNADRGKSEGGARGRLRRFFESRVGQIVDKAELAKVAGIHEWARRVRELREKEGLQILSHNDRADLKPGPIIMRRFWEASVGGTRLYYPHRVFQTGKR